MPNVAINGLGRIGRAALKILLDSDGLDLVAVNDVADVANLAYLLKYDTVYGRYHRRVSTVDGGLLIDGRRIATFAEQDPANLPWADLGVDLVLECTGVFKTEDDLTKHLRAGAAYVILSAPTSSEAVPTVVHGVNRPDGAPQLISCASCTTNCITPVIEIAHRRIGVERAVMTTVTPIPPPSSWWTARARASDAAGQPQPTWSPHQPERRGPPPAPCPS